MPAPGDLDARVYQRIMPTTAAQQEMIERQLIARGIRDAAVLRAMAEVPREAFVPHELVEFAYADTPLPIDESQTISHPYVVALMLEALDLVITVDSSVLHLAGAMGIPTLGMIPRPHERRWGLR